jgi:hypothetical protein
MFREMDVTLPRPAVLAFAACSLAVTAAPAFAQAPVTPAPDAEALFHHADPALNRNLQASYPS